MNPVHFSSQEERDNSHDDGILIVKLARGQKIHMRCIAILGIGKQHAKWSPVSACSFMCKPVVIPNVAAFNLLSPDQQDEIRAVCREPHIFDSSHAGGPVDVENTKDWLFTGELEDVCRKVAAMAKPSLELVLKSNPREHQSHHQQDHSLPTKQNKQVQKLR